MGDLLTKIRIFIRNVTMYYHMKYVDILELHIRIPFKLKKIKSPVYCENDEGIDDSNCSCNHPFPAPLMFLCVHKMKTANTQNQLPRFKVLHTNG